MNAQLAQQLAWLSPQASVLKNMRRGLEKESLRMTPTGHLAQSLHPDGLGAALTHPYITTDYSEALIELITPATKSIDETLTFLRRRRKCSSSITISVKGEVNAG